MASVRNATLVFLVKRSEGEVSDICLAMKKRGFGAGRWNGAGGKVEKSETIEDAVRREAREEIGVELREISKIGELIFNFANNPTWDMLVHAYLCESWEGEPQESEEMRPQWFTRAEIPFTSMWPDDEYWVPHILEGRQVKAQFTFGEKDAILEKNIDFVEYA